MQILNQPTLWRLYTNTAFRREFLFDKEEFYQRYNVSVDIIHFLNDTPVYELATYAETLLKQRMKKVRTLLPLTFQLIGKDIPVHFFKYCDSYFSKSSPKQEEDADQFVLYLLTQSRFSDSFKYNVYARAILMFEQQRIKEVKAERSIPDYHRKQSFPFHETGRRFRRQRMHIQHFAVIDNWKGQSGRKRNKDRKKYTTPFLLQKCFR